MNVKISWVNFKKQDICILKASESPTTPNICLHVVLTSAQKFFDAPLSRKFSLILFLLNAGWA